MSWQQQNPQGHKPANIGVDSDAANNAAQVTPRGRYVATHMRYADKQLIIKENNEKSKAHSIFPLCG